MDTYDHILPKNFHKSSPILFDNAIEFIYGITMLALYEHSSCGEANTTLVYRNFELKIKGEHYLQK